ncbi:VOC family protein [Pedococcus sp. KACC 23699]|uniref:VOC family protein n=1 Tax=Pedococcus sp. KACC 23699 TaxID=3149228 RepID=A0AAU7JYG4_9MICO
MALARFQDLCLDVTDEGRQAAFWSSALGLTLHEGRSDPAVLVGATPQQSLWLNTVPEPKTVKHRVHLDVHTESVEALEALGATVVVPATPEQRWTVMADPEGGEFCAFVRSPERLQPYRLYEVCVDCADPGSVARWWGRVLGLSVGNDPEHDWWWLEPASASAGNRAADGGGRGTDRGASDPGLPFESLVFVAVPEPKTGKNRLHWDVQTPSVAVLVEAGATIVAERPDWTVLADPEGNEFCAFPDGG